MSLQMPLIVQLVQFSAWFLNALNAVNACPLCFKVWQIKELDGPLTINNDQWTSRGLTWFMFNFHYSRKYYLFYHNKCSLPILVLEYVNICFFFLSICTPLFFFHSQRPWRHVKEIINLTIVCKAKETNSLVTFLNFHVVTVSTLDCKKH